MLIVYSLNPFIFSLFNLIYFFLFNYIGKNILTDSECVGKFEIMDGSPAKGNKFSYKYLYYLIYYNILLLILFYFYLTFPYLILSYLNL